MKFLTTLLTVLGLTVGAAQASTLPQVIGSTFELYKDGQGNCTTQFVEGGVFLTAQHCMNGGEFSVYVPELDEDFNKITETYFYLDILKEGNLLGKGEDITVLETRSNLSYLIFNEIDMATQEQIDALEIGDKLVAIGWPGAGWSNDLYISEGIFLGYTESPGGKVPGRWIKTSIPVDYGSSGGGLYLIEDGEYYFVSVTSQRDPGATAPMSYFTDPKVVREIYNKAVNPTPKDVAIDEAASAISELFE